MSKTSYATTCSYCGVGCGITISKEKDGKIRLQGTPDHPVNQGQLCSKGRNLNYVLENQSERLFFPQMRISKGHELRRVSWDTAIERTTATFAALIRRFGPDSVGFYVSGQCLTEEYYYINKLVKGFIGTNNLDTNSRLCMSSAVTAYTMALGEDLVPPTYEDLDQADTLLVAGANPAWCHPILWRRVEALKERHPETKIIVIDPRRTQTASLADLHISIIPGTDALLFQVLGKLLIDLNYSDSTFLQHHVEGFETFKNTLSGINLTQASAECGSDLETLIQVAHWIGKSKNFMSLWSMGLNQSPQGVHKNLQLLNLHLLTGQIGKEGSGPFSLTGQPNAMGGREVGGLSTLLAAHRKLSDPSAREEVAKFWGVEKINGAPGLTATQMIESLNSGKLKALWIICTNPMVSLPDSGLTERALQKARFLVVQDISVKNEAISYADVVLPAAGWGEKEGTMTNSERRISHLSAFAKPPGEALPDLEILQKFALKMGFRSLECTHPEEVFLEHAALTEGTRIDISGLNYSILKKNRGIRWPYPKSNPVEAKGLFLNKKFAHPDGKARMITFVPQKEHEERSPDFPLILTTGRIRDQWHTMTRTGLVQKLQQHIPLPFLEIHPEDASSRGIKEGDVVWVKGRRGEIKSRAKLSLDIRQGVVFLPMHWGKILGNSFAKTNRLTGNSTDPNSFQPDFKFSAVEVQPFTKPLQKIIIVGAGAAAYRFIQTYRELNSNDEIHVFSKEPHPFYNRVLLPDYVSRHKSWDELQKFSKEELAKTNIHLYKSNGIQKINRSQKTVEDELGQIHSYDLLILATGSRAFVPPDAPVHLPGIFTLRNKQHADGLMQHLQGRGHVLIIGGGLLGLELAASIRELKIRVSLVQLASRLMERQLDPVSSSLLAGKIEEMGITLYLDNQVHQIKPSQEERLQVFLKSGLSLSCEAVVYAIGTRPNMELAKDAGLECGMGVKVNAYLQTSDPDILAMGEIAQFEQKLNGITAAAEQQADVAARFLNGDELSFYTGTIPMNILKFQDMDLCSMGIPEIPANSKDYEEILLIDKSKAYYKKCIIHQDRLVGAILLGDKSEFAEFKRLIEERTELSEKRNELLRGSSSKPAPKGKLVCSCANVGAGNILELIEAGTREFRQLCKESGAGLGCGSCKPEVKQLLELQSQSLPSLPQTC